MMKFESVCEIGIDVLCRSDGQSALLLLRRRPETLAADRRSVDGTPTMVYAMSVRHQTWRTTSDGEKHRKSQLYSSVKILKPLRG